MVKLKSTYLNVIDIIKLKINMIQKLQARCFWIHIFIFKFTLYLDFTFQGSVLLYILLFSVTIMNKSFHKELTKLHFKFLFSSFGLEWTFAIYSIIEAYKKCAREPRTQKYLYLICFSSAGLLADQLFYAKETNMFFWGSLLFLLGLKSYFENVLLPIYSPVKNASSSENHKKAGLYQIRFFHQTSTVEAPFGKFAAEFGKAVVQNPKPLPNSAIFGLGFGGVIGIGFGIVIGLGFDSVIGHNQYMLHQTHVQDLAQKEKLEAFNLAREEKLQALELHQKAADYFSNKCGHLSGDNMGSACEGLKGVLNMTYQALEQVISKG